MKQPPHKCPVTGCNVMVKPKILMCAAHWAMVPKEIKADVWLYFRDGPWARYMETRAKAIQHVEKEERNMAAAGVQQPLL